MNYEQLDDSELVRYLRKHPDDQDGWKVMLGRHNRLIWKRIYRFRDADDLYQEIMLAIWKGLLYQYSGKGSVFSYIAGIVYRQAMKAYGQETRTPQPVSDEEEEAAFENIPDPHADAERHALLQEARRMFKPFFQRLRPREREVLILRAFEYEHLEIGRMLGITANASRQFQFKAEKKLAAYCEKLGIDIVKLKSGMVALFEEGELHEILERK
jgi:RNA polymerase sigma factor (sigma-70 family)